MNMDGLFINANVCLATCQANIMRFNLKKVQNSGDAKNFSMDFTYFFFCNLQYKAGEKDHESFDLSFFSCFENCVFRCTLMASQEIIF